MKKSSPVPCRRSGSSSYWKLGQGILQPATTPPLRPQSGPRTSDISWPRNPGPSPVPLSFHPTSDGRALARHPPGRREARQVLYGRVGELKGRASGLRVLTCSAGGARVAGKTCARPPRLGKPGADNRAPPKPGGVEREGKRGCRVRWGEGGPKDTSGSKFPELYIPDYRVSPGTPRSKAKSPSQESERESGTPRRASSTGRRSGATPEAPALIPPCPSRISSSRSPQRIPPESRAP